MLILRGHEYTQKVFGTLSGQQYSFKLFSQLLLQCLLEGSLWLEKKETSLIN